MANYAVHGRGCLTFLIVILLILVIVIAAAVVVCNMTPDALGLGGVEIGGKTIDEMGYGDKKMSELVQYYLELIKEEQESKS